MEFICSDMHLIFVQIGTGFTDVDLEQHAKFFKDHVTEKPKPYYRYDSSVEPDHWFDAVQVWEVKCADLSISPTHLAAAGIVSLPDYPPLRMFQCIIIQNK